MTHQGETDERGHHHQPCPCRIPRLLPPSRLQLLIQVVTVTSRVLAPLPRDLESGRNTHKSGKKKLALTRRRTHGANTTGGLGGGRRPCNFSTEGRFSQNSDYANRGEAAMGSRASDATNKIKAEVFAANLSHRRPSSEGTPIQATTDSCEKPGWRVSTFPLGFFFFCPSLALSPRLERLFPSSCGNRHLMSRLGFPPPKGSHMGPRLLPV
nr:uncharacterized protein LOC105705861 [Aotus nancymaae]